MIPSEELISFEPSFRNLENFAPHTISHFREIVSKTSEKYGVLTQKNTYLKRLNDILRKKAEYNEPSIQRHKIIESPLKKIAFEPIPPEKQSAIEDLASKLQRVLQTVEDLEATNRVLEKENYNLQKKIKKKAQEILERDSAPQPAKKLQPSKVQKRMDQEYIPQEFSRIKAEESMLPTLTLASQVSYN